VPLGRQKCEQGIRGTDNDDTSFYNPIRIAIENCSSNKIFVDAKLPDKFLTALGGRLDELNLSLQAFMTTATATLSIPG